MPLVRFFAEDPGIEILTDRTGINLIENLALGNQLAEGQGILGYVAAVVDDRGAPAVPYQLPTGTGLRDLVALFGGFKSWMGDALPAALESSVEPYDDRGAGSGYEGNAEALSKGLSAPKIVLQPPDLAIKDDSIDAATPGVDLLVTFTRSVATFGEFALNAGTRISDGAVGTPYTLATLERVSWLAAETGDRTVRCRQVSPAATVPVALNTVTTFVDAAADTNVTVSTTDVTVPDGIDATELVLRYEHALTHMLDNIPGISCELVVADRTEAAIGDAVAQHCLDATAQGYFRLCAVAPPLGTTATDARDTTGDGVKRTTLQRSYASYCHPAWGRQFRTDSDNLNAATDYVTSMPSHIAWGFLAANRPPWENPARPHPILTAYKITGLEPLGAGQPDRTDHEQAGITQPIIETDINANPQASYHASPMADGLLKFATRRMAFWLYRQLIALSLPFHKAFASQTNREAYVDSITAFLLREKTAGHIAAFTQVQGEWDPESSNFTVSVAIQETGNMDVITLRPTFGPAAIQDSDVQQAA